MKKSVKIILIILLVILLSVLVARMSSAQTKEIADNNDLWFTIHSENTDKNVFDQNCLYVGLGYRITVYPTVH
jgi:uncharacterized protein YxeA